MNTPDWHDLSAIANLPDSVVIRIRYGKPYEGLFAEECVYVRLSAYGAVTRRSSRREPEWVTYASAKLLSDTPIDLAARAAVEFEQAVGIAEHYAETLKAHSAGDADREPAPEIELAHTEAMMFTEMDFLHEEAEAMYDLWKWQQAALKSSKKAIG